MRNVSHFRSMFFSVALIFLSSFPQLLFAGIVPCGETTNSPCTICHLIVGVSNIINYGMAIIVYVSLAAIVFAGILYVISSGNPSLTSKAKEFIISVLKGFSLVLMAWLVVNLTFWLFSAQENESGDYSLGLESKTWYSFDCSTESSSTSTTQTGQGGQTATPTSVDCSGLNIQSAVAHQCGQPDVSDEIMNVLGCMATEIGADQFQISSLTDNNGGGASCNTVYTTQCPKNSSSTTCCHHNPASCHYGGTGSCAGTSYAADISYKGSKANVSTLKAAASKCGATAHDEGDHLHVSVGKQAGCGCDTNLY